MIDGQTTSDVLGVLDRLEQERVTQALSKRRTVDELRCEFVLTPPGDDDEPLGWLGGDDRNPTWDEYIQSLRLWDERVVPYVQALRVCCERDSLVGLYGDEAGRGCFPFNDGVVLRLSFRAFGDFMQAVVGKREGYMAYYCCRGHGVGVGVHAGLPFGYAKLVEASGAKRVDEDAVS